MRRFCNATSIVAVSSTIDLLLATFDLAAVRAVTGAIQRADAAVAKSGVAGVSRITPEPVIENRVHIVPQPEIKARDVFHRTPRIEPRVIYRPERVEFVAEYIPVAPAVHVPLHSPIPPVWKTLPAVIHVPAPHRVKYVSRRTDIQPKGLMIDTFI